MEKVSNEFQHQQCFQCGALMTSSATPALLSDTIMVFSDKSTNLDEVLSLEKDSKSVTMSCRIVGGVGPEKSVFVKDEVIYCLFGDSLSVVSAPFVFEGKNLLIMTGEKIEEIDCVGSEYQLPPRLLPQAGFEHLKFKLEMVLPHIVEGKFVKQSQSVLLGKEVSLGFMTYFFKLMDDVKIVSFSSPAHLLSIGELLCRVEITSSITFLVLKFIEGMCVIDVAAGRVTGIGDIPIFLLGKLVQLAYQSEFSGRKKFFTVKVLNGQQTFSPLENVRVAYCVASCSAVTIEKPEEVGATLISVLFQKKLKTLKCIDQILREKCPVIDCLSVTGDDEVGSFISCADAKVPFAKPVLRSIAAIQIKRLRTTATIHVEN